MCRRHAPLAQLVEQLTLNQWVLGSSPRRRTKMARWSSGQDGGLSRRKREFDSPTGHHVERSRHRSVSARRDENSAKSAPFSLAKQNPLRWAFVSNKGPQEI